MEPSKTRAWTLVDTIGPVFSHFGLRNWDLCLARDAIIACPRSLWVTVKAGLMAGVGSGAGMQRAWASGAGPVGQRVLQDEGEPGWNRYARREISAITILRRAGGANEIRIARHGTRPDVYGLGDRGQTDRCRLVLRDLYPDLYREENFLEGPPA